MAKASNKIPRMPPVPAIPKPGVRRRPPPQQRMLPPRRPTMNRALQPLGDDSLDMMSPDGQLGFAPSAEERIAEWLDTRVLPRNVVGLTLRLSQKVPGGESVVNEWPVDEIANEIEGNDVDAGSVAALIYGAAVEELQTGVHQGVTAYVVQAIRPGDVAGFARCFFRLAPEDMTAGFDSEDGATSQGHMAQAHRHAEVYARMMVGQSESVMRHLREQNREFFMQASKSITLQVQVAEMFQKIQDRQMMRDIILKRVTRKEQMKEQVIGYAMSFLPDVLNRFGIVPGEQKAMLQNVVALEGVLATLDPAQVNMITMALPSKQARDAFAAVYVGAKRKAESAAAKAIADAAKKAANTADKNGKTDLAIGTAAAIAGALQAAPAQAAAAQPETKPAESVDLTDEDKKIVFKTVSHFISLLVGLDDGMFQLALGRIPEGVRQTLADVRIALRAFKLAQKKDKGATAPKITPDQLLAIQGTIVQLAATLDDMSWGILVSKIDKKVQPDVARAREIIRARLGGAAS